MTAAITVVIPTRNRRHMLQQALDSVLRQQGPEVRAVVVDEASTDDTAQYLAGLGDDRVRVVRHEIPKRLPGARNAGLAHVDTDWVSFCDDDDVWAPDKLAAQLRRLDEVPGAAWSCTGCVYVDDDMKIVGGHRPLADGDVLAAILTDNMIPAGGSSVLVRTELVRRLGGFRTLPASEDWDMWIRLAREAPLAAVDRPLVGYRIHATSHSHDVDMMERSDALLAEEYAEDRARLGVEPEWLEKQRYYARQEVHRGHRFAAARRQAAIARRTRRRRDAVAAGLALLSPHLLGWLWLRRADRHLDPSWTAQALPWLASYRADA